MNKIIKGREYWPKQNGLRFRIKEIERGCWSGKMLITGNEINFGRIQRKIAFYEDEFRELYKI